MVTFFLNFWRVGALLKKKKTTTQMPKVLKNTNHISIEIIAVLIQFLLERTYLWRG